MCVLSFRYRFEIHWIKLPAQFNKNRCSGLLNDPESSTIIQLSNELVELIDSVVTRYRGKLAFSGPNHASLVVQYNIIKCQPARAGRPKIGLAAFSPSPSRDLTFRKHENRTEDSQTEDQSLSSLASTLRCGCSSTCSPLLGVPKAFNGNTASSQLGLTSHSSLWL